MEKIIDSLQDTSKFIKEQEDSINSSIDLLLKHENRLKSYLLLKILVSKSEEALSQMKSEVPDIEMRLFKETEEVCEQAKKVINGLKMHSAWFEDIMNALGILCKDTDLATRNIEIHNQIDEMEKALNVLTKRRNELPMEQLDKE